jgi:hypothetical protein
MQKLHITFLTSIAVLAVFTMTAVLLANSFPVRAAQPNVNLGAASPFAILAGTPNITDAGNASVIKGNVGLSPATGAGIGLLCSQVTGVIYSVDASGPICRVNDSPLLTTVKNDLTAAYIDAAGRTPLTTVPTELGGTTLVAGVYDSSSTTFGISAGAGALVLDGQNDPSSIFIFQAPFSGTGLSVGSGSTVTLTNGAQACNIFWRVDTASINSTATFVGTVLALNSITVANGATIEGRLLARNGNVTLINDTITVPTCAAVDTGGEGDGGGTGSTDNDSEFIPGFPNTGSMGTSILLIALGTFLLATGILVGHFLYKKRLG